MSAPGTRLQARRRQAINALQSRKGRAVAAALVLAGGGSYACYLQFLQHSRSKRQPRNGAHPEHNGRKPGGGKQGKGNGAQSLKQLLAFLLPLARRKIIMLLVLAVLRTGISNRLARIQGYMFRSAFLKRVPLFLRNLTENVILCLLAAAIESTAQAVKRNMVLDWRNALTSRIHKSYFANMTYYKLSYVDRRVDNPEQRICEDIPRLTEGLGELVGEWATSLVDALFFSYMLRAYSRTNRYTAAIIGYVLGAGVLTVAVSPNFGRLYKRQAENEGSYRQLQTRLRNNAESVAFYGGIEKEGGLIRSSFTQLVKHRAKLLRTQWLYSIWQDFHTKYLAATMAVALIIGPFFTGHLRPGDSMAGRAKMLSNMRYHTSVIISLFVSLGVLADSSRRLMKLSAYAQRIQQLQSISRSIASGKVENDALANARGIMDASADEIAFINAQVVTPANATLVKNLNLRVPAGTNLLVTGPNGSGKSSLFRVLGGLWPLTRGVVRKPGGSEAGLAAEIFYVPQRPYVTLGTLQDQLIYPLSRQEEGDVVGEARLRELLAEVDLQYLVDREGGPDAVVDWAAQLSLGEQQRLGMARLFYHQPKFAILDECTSGVTVDMEERFCSRVKQMGCTCITISHRPALVAFHDLVLALDGEGGWTIRRGARAQEGRTSFDGEEPSGRGEADSFERAGDAAACLEGLTDVATPDNSTVFDRVLDRAPPLRPALSAFDRPPAAVALKTDRQSTWSRWRSVARLLLGNAHGAGRQIATILVVVSLRTLLQDRMAALNGRTVKYVLNQDRRAFARLIGLSVFQALASAILAPSLRQVADSLALEWRKQLTAAAHRGYLSGNTFYSVSQLAGMQDVDQRLTKDVERLADDLSKLIPSLIKPVVDIAWFSVQLRTLTGNRGMAILYAYALLGFAALRALTPNFGALAKQEYFLEGAFRNVHARLRTHAESVAFFGGGAREGATVESHFSTLIAHLRRVINFKWAHAVADDFFAKQLPHNVTWGLTMLYSLDHTGDFSDSGIQGALVNDMRYLASVVTACFSSFGELLALHKRFAELSGGVTRVSELLETISKAKELEASYHLACITSPTKHSGKNASIEFRQADIATPTGKVLARQLSLRIQTGSSLLVTGPNGSGKSSIFRVLGGLWPLASGSATCFGDAPGSLAPGDVFYVPQKPYTTVGTLRDQVLYPAEAAEAAAAEEGATEDERLAALDARLDGLMDAVKLRYLVAREGGWAVTHEWGDTLSLGEQQRLGMARLFYHRPRFGVLDECTNATSVDVEEHLYRHASDLGITLITITQRAALLKYHAAELRLLDGEGDWQLQEIKHAIETTQD